MDKGPPVLRQQCWFHNMSLRKNITTAVDHKALRFAWLWSNHVCLRVSHSAEFTWRPLLSPVWVTDKGNHVHSDFIMESTDISSSVGYQDTWWEALFIQLNTRRRRRSSQVAAVCSCFPENHLKSLNTVSVFLCTHLLHLFWTGIKCLLKKDGRDKHEGFLGHAKDYCY